MENDYQAVKLGHRTLAAWLADVPNLDTTFAASVDMTGGITDGDGTHYFPMAQSVDLASVARDAWPYQGVWGEGHGLHLTIRADVKGISSVDDSGSV